MEATELYATVARLRRETIDASEWAGKTVKGTTAKGRHLLVAFTDGTFGVVTADSDCDCDAPGTLDDWGDADLSDYDTLSLVALLPPEEYAAVAADVEAFRAHYRELSERDEQNHYLALKAKYGA